ncbi:MAG: tRNA (adenosine(37)-N6)-threonylcarbamoyltransferase complex dimerization subunit type 1 TsaB [Bacteroidetes bacterium]|nr:tRNA (adenosine(37)-N6)-threonylcarbamoyltransferase complex dimerization subunit type 1 TsaB [Bacteroidota bacterium]
MSFLLFIDTSAAHSTLLLLKDDEVVASRKNEQQLNHAQWIHKQLDEILTLHELTWSDISGVCVLNGPGSYTGLRISLSVAKGICYARELPLILLNKLEVMYEIALAQTNRALLCIMKAREDEFFSGYLNLLDDMDYQIMNKLEINEKLTNDGLILGIEKNQLSDEFDNFVSIELSDLAISRICFKYFRAGKYADLFNSEPFYLKNFHFNKINKL